MWANQNGELLQLEYNERV